MRWGWSWVALVAGCNLEPVAGVTQDDLDVLAGQIEALQAQLTALEEDCVRDTDLPSAVAAALEGADVLTTADLTGYATETWVREQDYLTAADLTGYATETWVGSQGYLTAADLVDYALAADLAALDARMTAVEDEVDVLAETSLTADDHALLLDLLGYVEVGPFAVRFVGANVYVQNGLGRTNQANGVGNLILGYNEDPGGILTRDGSHDLIVGEELEYGGTGGVFVRSIVQSDLFDGRGLGVFQSQTVAVPNQAGAQVILTPPRNSVWLISGVPQVGGPVAAEGLWQVTATGAGQCAVVRLDGLARPLMSCNLNGEVEIDRGGARFTFIRLL